MTALYPPGGVAVPAFATDDDRLARIERKLDRLVADTTRRDEELQALRDLAAEVGLVAGPALDAVSGRLAALEERGYLDFARGGAAVVDRVVTSFDEDDVAALGDNIVLILQTLRELTQPEVLALLRRTAVVAHAPEVRPPEPPPSTWQLLRQLREPAVRHGLARLVELLRSVGSGDPPLPAPEPSERR